ncbi:MAG: 16S rRNA (adenine(1518)-N(6)/adenine(1519)-N(6))-dimethyltransferase RsmA [Bacteroidetes bacterium]|nr:16S rRNA (adenine(1518)-N(6)/adenine(1519)-N(6))-dimethyltransferase RsmA [Bacteroidota bacterium]MDA0904319.1 16S rRNA (adenine(1518)-N(6)/adenine(1519)-N(6))-dimethyltransferase RsmA [Bacteroidota bacterium]MDA1242818.1 16S rRNA (adenine(1518)-N(6)/adenine(1519)-N(6))-dimethyltransferase RsmA [Bacteroidota bacterium]
MHVRAKKHLGQHFLRDLDAARRIAEGITKHHGCADVLEVGPGMGALTRPLLDRGDLNVHAVELDHESVEYLISRGVLTEDRVFGVDLLTWNPDEAFPDGAPFIVAGNFPYNISSQILFRVLDWRDRVPECVGMFQKEVAERVAEGPGSKTYGILSVLLQSYYDIEYLFTVHENAFDPPPKVKSGVIRLVRNDVMELPFGLTHPHFQRVVKAAFSQRRKTLRNSIKSGGFDANRIPEAFQSQRAEQLSVAQFHELAASLMS